MAKVKWRAREYTPTGKMTGSHSFYAEAVISNEITNDELSAKIAARTGFKAYEVKAVIAAVADIVAEEVLESNRVILCDEKGTKMVSIYPKVTGGISDEDVKANSEKYGGKTVAEEDMLTADLLTWTLGATIGVKFSKDFAANKQAQKVKVVAASDDSSDDSSDDQGGGDDSGDDDGGNVN